MFEKFKNIQNLDQVNFPRISSNERFGRYYSLLANILKGDNLKVFNLLKTYYQNISIRDNGSDLTADSSVTDFLQFYQYGGREATGIGSKYEELADNLLSKIRENLTQN